jgi:hypothetical protein
MVACVVAALIVHATETVDCVLEMAATPGLQPTNPLGVPPLFTQLKKFWPFGCRAICAVSPDESVNVKLLFEVDGIFLLPL